MTHDAVEPPGPRDEHEPSHLPTDPADADVHDDDNDSDVVVSGDDDPADDD